jgi:septal ring factor EnvC (AmiA/AmiB activator)
MEDEALHNVVASRRPVSTSTVSPMMGAVLDDDSHAPLDATTQELLLKENKQLERQLRTMVDQIRDVESQMATIASAQAFISSNISQTRDDLELIQTQSVDIQSNFATGNINLQQAAQSGVTFRIFVLMFLLTLSFSLLVMHWTYD